MPTISSQFSTLAEQALREYGCQMRELTNGGYIDRADRSVDRRLRYRQDASSYRLVCRRMPAEAAGSLTTAAALVNELVEPSINFSSAE
jgi:hypothetical protein